MRWALVLLACGLVASASTSLPTTWSDVSGSVVSLKRAQNFTNTEIIQVLARLYRDAGLTDTMCGSYVHQGLVTSAGCISASETDIPNIAPPPRMRAGMVFLFPFAAMRYDGFTCGLPFSSSQCRHEYTLWRISVRDDGSMFSDTFPPADVRVALTSVDSRASVTGSTTVTAASLTALGMVISPPSASTPFTLAFYIAVLAGVVLCVVVVLLLLLVLYLCCRQSGSGDIVYPESGDRVIMVSPLAAPLGSQSPAHSVSTLPPLQGVQQVPPHRSSAEAASVQVAPAPPHQRGGSVNAPWLGGAQQQGQQRRAAEQDAWPVPQGVQLVEEEVDAD